MRELKVNEIEQVNGGFPPLILLAAEGIAIAGGLAAGRALGNWVKSLF